MSKVHRCPVCNSGRWAVRVDRVTPFMQYSYGPSGTTARSGQSYAMYCEQCGSSWRVDFTVDHTFREEWSDPYDVKQGEQTE